MPVEIEALRRLAESHPILLAALAGGGTGAAIGGFSSDSGEEGKGAIGGALLGGGLGAGMGMMSEKGRQIVDLLTPNPQQALIAGGLLGGAIGGRYAKQTISPWLKERLSASHDGAVTDQPKEASVSNEAKKPEELEKEASERLVAFDAGLEQCFADEGVTKEAVAKAVGIEDPAMLAAATIACLSQQVEEKK